MTKIIEAINYPEHSAKMREKWNKAIRRPEMFDRVELLDLLTWCDSNGCYTDDATESEGFDPTTWREAVDHMWSLESGDESTFPGFGITVAP